MSLAIQTQNLRKDFKGRAAVEGLNLEVHPGEVFGFLGPNGAGKTTTIKMLLGLTHPTSGDVQVLGQSPQNPETRKYIGYLPEMFRFHDWLSGQEFLRFHADLYGMSQEVQQQRIPEVLELVGLKGREKERIRGYSKGMQQRIGLAQAILHRPKLVFLDEPTSALDPLGRREVREIIAHLKAEGTTVFLNSHLLTEVEQTCERVAIVNKGRVVRSGRMEELLSGLEVEIRVDALTANLREALSRLGKVLEWDERGVRLEISDENLLPQIAATIHQQGIRLYALVPKRISLEDFFVSLVEPKIPEGKS